MAKSKNKKPILYPVFFMVLVTAIFTSALAIVNELSAERIQALNAIKLKTNVLYVLGYDINQSPEALSALYDSTITEEKRGDQIIYVAQGDDSESGYAFHFVGPGLWGTIRGLVAISSDFESLKGISFISHSETPGLGGRIDEPWYKEQFRGIPLNGDNTVIYKPKEGGNADSISGATSTSDAVRKIINSHLEDAPSLIGGGQ